MSNVSRARIILGALILGFTPASYAAVCLSRANLDGVVGGLACTYLGAFIFVGSYIACYANTDRDR